METEVGSGLMHQNQASVAQTRASSRAEAAAASEGVIGWHCLLECGSASHAD